MQIINVTHFFMGGVKVLVQYSLLYNEQKEREQNGE